jgi:hypothetical protein
MGINVFEGARRIAKLVTLLWVVGCVIYTIDDVLDLRKQNLEAQVKQSLTSKVKETPWQGQQPAFDPEEYKAFLAKEAQQGVPDITPEDMAEYDRWKAKKQPEDYPELPIFEKPKTAVQKTWEHIVAGLLWLFGGVVFIWTLTWAIGWIVRGFFGIPSGHDFKP